jgi:signal transduction histidine kinase
MNRPPAPRPATLRRRVTIASAAVGFVLCVLFSLATVAVAEDYEHVLASEILRGQAEDYGLRIANGLPVQLPRTNRLSGYLTAPPPRYAAFGPGVHEDPAREGIHVGVFDTAAGRLIFVIDLGDIEKLEQHLNLFLALITLFGVTASAWLGWLFAGRALAPVGQLSDAVEALPNEPAPTQFEALVGDDELGDLARSIDAYQARLVEADARQLAFFADASHALRTPIAVVQGVAEVLLDEPQADDAGIARLRRLDRGVQEMTELIELLLGLARRAPVQREAVELGALLREALAPWAEAQGATSLEVDAAGVVELPRRESVLLLRALARKYFRDVRRLRIGGDTTWLEMADPDGARAGESGARSDAGALSPLLARAAERVGWRLRVEDGRVAIALA